MKERHRHNLGRDVHLEPGDVLQVSIQDRETKTQDSFMEKIGRKITVDTIVTFDVDEPVFGLTEGIGAVFGKAAK